MRKDKKQMEYEEAPSGYVTLYNYKEPFMKFEGGYGFQGVLLFDGESDKVQCHLCGQWFMQLGSHLIKEHNMHASDYKEYVGLYQTTALIGETMREKLVASGQSRFKNLKPGSRHTEETKKKIRETLKKNGNKRENQNFHGTCPAQLLSRLQSEYQRLGYTPRQPGHAHSVPKKHREEAIASSKRLGAEETYIRVFGSWQKALQMANIPIRKPGQTMNTWTEKRAIEWATNFIDSQHRKPKLSEIPASLAKKFDNGVLDKAKIIKEASIQSDKCKGLKGIRYSKEQLIDFLRNFKSMHNRLPSYSDSKRGLIPHLRRYSYNFGSWKKALSIAFDK